MWQSIKTGCLQNIYEKFLNGYTRSRKHKHPILPGLYISPERSIEKSINFNLTKPSSDFVWKGRHAETIFHNFVYCLFLVCLFICLFPYLFSCLVERASFQNLVFEKC